MMSTKSDPISVEEAESDTMVTVAAGGGVKRRSNEEDDGKEGMKERRWRREEMRIYGGGKEGLWMEGNVNFGGNIFLEDILGIFYEFVPWNGVVEWMLLHGDLVANGILEPSGFCGFGRTI
ncbi:hypothetical protein Droror1_Dr00027571 [Drosera rotundifolia]